MNNNLTFSHSPSHPNRTNPWNVLQLKSIFRRFDNVFHRARLATSCLPRIKKLLKAFFSFAFRIPHRHEEKFSSGQQNFLTST
jgi:hypothetical protein